MIPTYSMSHFSFVLFCWNGVVRRDVKELVSTCMKTPMLFPFSLRAQTLTDS
jgi:hypothetical protein